MKMKCYGQQVETQKNMHTKKKHAVGAGESATFYSFLWYLDLDYTNVPVQHMQAI